MAQFSTKLPSNVGATSPVSGGNVGFSTILYEFLYVVTGTPAAVTAVPLGAVPAPCSFAGLSIALNTVSTGTITFTPVKIPVSAPGTPVNLCSTQAAIASTATGPVLYTNLVYNGATYTSPAATGVTAAVLASPPVQFAQGDQVGITTAGTFTSSAGLAVTIWVREDNGQY